MVDDTARRFARPSKDRAHIDGCIQCRYFTSMKFHLQMFFITVLGNSYPPKNSGFLVASPNADRWPDPGRSSLPSRTGTPMYSATRDEVPPGRRDLPTCARGACTPRNEGSGALPGPNLTIGRWPLAEWHADKRRVSRLDQGGVRREGGRTGP